MKLAEIKGDGLFEEAISKIGSSSRIVVCGDIESRELLEEHLEYSKESTESIIEKSTGINPAEWFRNRKVEYQDDFELDEEEIVGVWPQNILHQGFILDKNISTGQLLERVVVAQFEVEESWEIPAHFKYGGWNECPNPEDHCAIWKYWQSKYDAHIVGVSNDTIEAKVFKPPTTKEQAMELAWEQYLYCSDLVDQGMESISNLAAILQNHDVWFFWWD